MSRTVVGSQQRKQQDEFPLCMINKNAGFNIQKAAQRSTLLDAWLEYRAETRGGGAGGRGLLVVLGVGWGYIHANA